MTMSIPEERRFFGFLSARSVIVPTFSHVSMDGNAA